MSSLMFTCGFITTEEIRSLSTTPALVVPPPGDGYINVVLSISVHLQYNSQPFQNGSDLLVSVGNVDIFRCMTKDVLCMTEDYMSFHKPYGINYFAGNNSVNLINQGIYIKADGDAFTGGDSAIHYDIMYGALPVHYYPY